MSESARTLADRFEAAHDAFMSYVEGLDEVQWLTLVPDEQRTVAAMVHHIAWGYAVEMESFVAMAEGRNPKTYTMDDFARFNAAHGEEYAECDKTETLALLRANGLRAASKIRTFTDEQLERTGKYVETAPEMTVSRWIERVLTGHITGHERNIRETLGHGPVTAEGPPA